mgnify:CR=1 FL=1
MTDKKNIDLEVPTVQGVPKSKSYYCPNCNKLIMKGDVKRLSMNCPHCLTLVDADEEELLNSENNEK